MQLGTRWPVGESVPAQLPDVVADAIGGVEDELKADDVRTKDWRWTLTWLEGRPIVELDDGTVITYNPHTQSATVRQRDDFDSEDDDY